MAPTPKISDADWQCVLDGRAARPPVPWRALAAPLGVSHQSLQARYRRHVEAERAVRAAERAAKAAVDPRRPETALPVQPAPERERKPGEPIEVGGYRDPRTLEYEMLQGRSGYLVRSIEVDLGRFAGNVHDDTEARALANAEQLRAQREADAEDFADGIAVFDPRIGRIR